MKFILSVIVAFLPVVSTLAQTPADNSYTYPTRLENLLHHTGVVINSSSQLVGTENGRAFQGESNQLTVVLRTEVISNASTRAKEYGVALQMRQGDAWRSRITYVDYDELDGLVAGINKLLALQPDLPVVQAKFETRGGLIAMTYSTEKREVLGSLGISNDDASRIRINLDTLRDFRDLITTAKQNLDLLKSAP